MINAAGTVKDIVQWHLLNSGMFEWNRCQRRFWYSSVCAKYAVIEY